MEMLLVIAILAILGTIGLGSYRNFAKTVELDSTFSAIIADSRTARAKAMAGENDLKWGGHFVNGASDYYEIFSTPTDYSSPSKTIKDTFYLGGGIVFTAPTEGLTTDVIFTKVTGTTTAATITISSEGRSKTVNFTAAGNIY